MTTTQVSSHTRNGKPVKGYPQRRKTATAKSRTPVSGRAKIAAGGVGLTLSAFGMIQSAFGLIEAVLTSATVLVGWGTAHVVQKKRKRRKAGTAKKPTTGTKVTRFGTVRLGDEKSIRAFTEYQQAKWDRHDAKWAPRKAAVKTVAYQLVGKKAPQ